jgi:hypothetical protein
MKIVAIVLGTLVLTHGCATQPPARPAPQTSVARKSAPSGQSSAAIAPRESTPQPVVEPNPTMTPAASTEPAPAPLTLEQRLDKRAVTDERYARLDLYSWTTPEQIRKLRQTNTLLVATAKTRGAPSPYSQLLSRLANGSGQVRDIAKLLSEHPGLITRRYAWPSPFATAVPLGERSYGHVLVHIVLKEESLVAKLDPLEKEPFSFVDIHGKPVPVADALANPERIAAVFHVRRKPDGGPRFREYIVCNESMIARWSIGTPHERAIVTEDAALIAELLQSPLVSTLGKNDALDANSAWSRRLDKPTLLDAWRAALAFDSPKYKPSPTTLTAIATSLAAYDPAGDPLDHMPTVAFPDKP